MQRRAAIGSRGGSKNIILVLLSCLACLYVGGRLWLDAIVRQELLQLAQTRSEKVESVSVDESMKLIDYKEQQKRLAILEMEVASARSKGFIPQVAEATANASSTQKKRLLAVIGINTGFGQRNRRDSIRNTWMPTGVRLKQLEEEHGVVIRFTIGHSANRGDMSDRAIDAENKVTTDFLVLNDHIEEYNELPKKTKAFFSTAVATWDADFYFKVDDDVYVNINRMIAMLTRHKEKPMVYLGCMKSGEVFTEPTQRWHEPEWWKFGDAKYYFRHATGQIYGLSKALALYVATNRQILHEYKNEDVSLGSWMLGLDVAHEDERRLCCASPPNGECERRKASGDGCIGVFDWQCSGLCQSVERMPIVHRTCG